MQESHRPCDSSSSSTTTITITPFPGARGGGGGAEGGRELVAAPCNARNVVKQARLFFIVRQGHIISTGAVIAQSEGGEHDPHEEEKRSEKAEESLHLARSQISSKFEDKKSVRVALTLSLPVGGKGGRSVAPILPYHIAAVGTAVCVRMVGVGNIKPTRHVRANDTTAVPGTWYY